MKRATERRILQVRMTAIPAILTIAACIAGFTICANPISPNRPVDDSGETSIVVYIGDMDGGYWAELRGPARWDVLECIGEPIVVDDYGDGTGEADYTSY